MKKASFILVACVLAVILFAQCKKDCDMVYNAQFYTPQSTGKLFLYIDGNYQGELPYMATAPECGKVYSDEQKPFTTQLRSGEYKLEGKDEHGVVRTAAIIRFDRKSSYLGGGPVGGGASFNTSGDCAIISLFE